MRKIIYLVFILILVCSCVALSGCDIGEEAIDKLNFAVLSDIHVVANSVLNENNIENYSSRDKMIHLSDAIFQSIADSLIEKQYDFVLFCGDMTENGDYETHCAVVKTLKKIENAGIDVYVINGNHDVMQTKTVNAVSQAQFAELYADFGYTGATSTLEGTLCYSTELNDDYRLIAIDNVSYYTDNSQTEKKPSFHEDISYWASEQAFYAKEEGKRSIVISHQPLLYHWPLGKQLFEENDEHAMNTDFLMLCSDFADYDAFFGFSGHNHFNDIKSYDNGNGRSYLDIQVGSTCYGYSEYYEVNIENNDVKCNIVRQTTVNEEYLDESIPEEMKTEIMTDFLSYSQKCLSEDSASRIQNYCRTAVYLLKGKGVDSVVKILWNNVIKKALKMPFYSDGENESLEDLVTQYGIELPKVSDENCISLFSTILSRLVEGDEYISSDEQTLIKYTFYSFFSLYNDCYSKIKEEVDGTLTTEFDLERLFTEDKVDLYSSSCLDCIFEILAKSTISQKLITGAEGILSEDLDDLYLIDDTVKSITLELLPGISAYFSGHDFLVGYFVQDGIFDNFIKDVVYKQELGERELQFSMDVE